MTIYSSYGRYLLNIGVSPFGHPRINTCLRLPAAFRSLPRPSSAPGGKAFTLRSFQLNLRYVPIYWSLARSFARIFRLRNCSCNSFSYLASSLLSFLELSCYSVFKVHSALSALGGDEGDRTPYLLLARQALSQMSYTPILCGSSLIGCRGSPFSRHSRASRFEVSKR